MRTGRTDLTAFRRLIGKPILKDVVLQDVVFAGGRWDCLDAQAASDRASVARVKDLGAAAKKLERQDLKSVRKGF